MRNGESEEKRLGVDTNSEKNKINFTSSEKKLFKSQEWVNTEWRGKVKFVISRSDDDVNEEGNVMFVLKNHWTFLHCNTISWHLLSRTNLPFNDARNIQFEVNFHKAHKLQPSLNHKEYHWILEVQFTVKEFFNTNELKMVKVKALVSCGILFGKWRMKIWKGNYNFYET